MCSFSYWKLHRLYHTFPVILITIYNSSLITHCKYNIRRLIA